MVTGRVGQSCAGGGAREQPVPSIVAAAISVFREHHVASLGSLTVRLVSKSHITGNTERESNEWRHWLQTKLLGGLLALTADRRRGSAAAADTYPARPVTIITPFAAGSQTDAAARLISQQLQETLGQSFVIENKAGAGGLLAAQRGRARQAGRLHAAAHHQLDAFGASALFKNVPYDPIKDFTPIARIGNFPSFVAVTPDCPTKSMAEFVAYAKANPGKLSYGIGNSTGQIVGETLKKRTGIDIVRVAYRSNPTAMTDLLAGHIQMMVPDMTTGTAAGQGGEDQAARRADQGAAAAAAGRADTA